MEEKVFSWFIISMLGAFYPGVFRFFVMSMLFVIAFYLK